jgi:ribosomal protein S18 acetylase RimI-like enzyme
VNLLPWLPDRPERTEVIHELTQRAFAPYAALPRPSGALRETVADVHADLALGGGVIAYDDTWDTPLGALRWRVEDDHLWVKRVAVDPAHQRRGVGNLLMDACQGLGEALHRERIRLGVRHALTDNRAWFERHGYRVMAEHDDWSELELSIDPIPFARRVTLWKYDHPDHLQGTGDIDVLDETDAGLWVRVPRYRPSFSDDGSVIWLPPYEVIGFLPWDEWWTAWFSLGHQRIKVDICTPAEWRDDGGLEFRDLCLDVVVWGHEAAKVIDEDEFEEAGYDAELAARTRATADDVLRRILDGEEPFLSEGFRRISR